MEEALRREAREELGIELTSFEPLLFKDAVREKYPDGRWEPVYGKTLDATGTRYVVSEDLRLLHIFVDADACPVKQEVYRVASRYGLEVTLVANSWLRTPDEPRIALEIVGDALDAADDWIVGQVRPHDIVITADILLAGRCLQGGSRVIGPTGKPFTESNIGDAIATRDLLSQLREAGELTGGPPPLTKRDRSRFLQQLDETIQSIRRQHHSNPT